MLGTSQSLRDFKKTKENQFPKVPRYFNLPLKTKQFNNQAYPPSFPLRTNHQIGWKNHFTQESQRSNYFTDRTHYERKQFSPNLHQKIQDFINVAKRFGKRNLSFKNQVLQKKVSKQINLNQLQTFEQIHYVFLNVLILLETEKYEKTKRFTNADINDDSYFDTRTLQSEVYAYENFHTSQSDLQGSGTQCLTPKKNKKINIEIQMDFTQTLSKLQKEIAQKNDIIKKLQNVLLQNVSDNNELSDKLDQAERQIQNLKYEVEQAQQSLNDFYEKQVNVQDDRKKGEQEIGILNDEIEDLKKEVERKNEEIEQLNYEVDEAKQNIKDKNDQIKDLNAKLKDWKRKVQQKQKQNKRMSVKSIGLSEELEKLKEDTTEEADQFLRRCLFIQATSLQVFLQNFQQ